VHIGAAAHTAFVMGKDEMRYVDMEIGELTGRMKEIYEEIKGRTDEVCCTQLNEEYAELARDMTELMASFSDSPLVRGKREIWAAGIVYALGHVNFLFDTHSAQYLGAEDLCNAFGVKKSSAYQKSLLIREKLEMFQLEPRWTLPSLQDENPYNWRNRQL
jgi:hypothetical protein